MAVISWGTPKIYIADYNPANGADDYTWTQLDTPVEGTTQIETSEGDKQEAKEEGGAVVDTFRKKSNYTLTFALFEKKGKDKPTLLQDEDGIITRNIAVLLVPEDTACNGYFFPKTSVSFQQTWTAEEGGRWVYSFDALVPDKAGLSLINKHIGAPENVSNVG